MLPTMILLGLAFALAYGPLTIAATDGVAEREQGLAGGLLNTAFQFGAALGVSAVTAGRGGPADPDYHVLRTEPWRIQIVRGMDLSSRIWQAEEPD